MLIDQVLDLLLSSLSLKNHKYNISAVTVNSWHRGVLKLLLDNGVLVPSEKSTNIQCQGCEKHCCIDVIAHKYPTRTLYYALCEDPYMHEVMGRMSIPSEQLKQWKVSVKQVAKVIARLLNLSSDVSYQANQPSIHLGNLTSNAGRKSVLLQIEPLALVINQCELPVNDLLYFTESALAFDMDKIESVLNMKQPPAGKLYNANTDKNEQRKANTQAMHASWQEAAEQLSKKHPNKSKTWISQQIAKTAIGHGRAAETIKRNIRV